MASLTTTPDTYRRLFEDHSDGRAVLDELTRRYGDNPYTRGGIEAIRETDFKAGKLEVITFILRQINRAHGSTEDETSSDTHPDE